MKKTQKKELVNMLIQAVRDSGDKETMDELMATVAGGVADHMNDVLEPLDHDESVSLVTSVVLASSVCPACVIKHLLHIAERGDIPGVRVANEGEYTSLETNNKCH
jgi:hypothetical protein